MEQAVFLVLAVLATVSALLVVLLRNPLHSAISLIGTLVALAGVFVLLDAHFLAAIQVLVYAGAIMVLFVFVIMLLDAGREEATPRRIKPGRVFAIAGVGLLLLRAVEVFSRPALARLASVAGDGHPAAPAPGFGGIEGVGRLLFGSMLLPFEVTSLLLLAAMVGTVVLARRRL